MRHNEQAREQRPRAYEYCINEMRTTNEWTNE
jgi:hypothetical protein